MRVDARRVGKDQPREGPVDHPHAPDVPRADGEVGLVCPDRLDETGQVLGVVGEVGVHLTDVAVVSRKGVPEATEVRGAEPELPAPFDEVNALGGRLHRVPDDHRGSVL
jgi:hypothetical protein